MSNRKLGFGLMRLPLLDVNDNGSIDYSQLQQMVDTFIERGFNYFDTAYFYCDGNSEKAVKKVLTKRYPRDVFSVTSKLPAYKIQTPEDRDLVFQEQLEKTGLAWFDYYFLHAVSARSMETFEKMDCFSWIKEKKAQGLVKKIGFSYHDGPELLDRILTQHPEFDVVQLQINYLDWESPAVQSRACYEVAVKHNKPVIVMEPVKGGALANVPEEVNRLFRASQPDMSIPSWAIRYAAGLENVVMVLSGMSDMNQLLDNTDYMTDFMPLNENQLILVEKAAELIRKSMEIACTGCGYCKEKCPANVAIAQYFALFNRAVTGEHVTEEYTELTKEFSKASECLDCGQCESICPQSLPIRKLLTDVSKRFE